VNAISFTKDALPGYYGDTPAVAAIIAYCHDDDLFKTLSASEKWGFLTFLTYWQWNCVDAGAARTNTAISGSFEEFGYELSPTIAALIQILNDHHANEVDAHILINALTNQIQQNIFAV
jgi:hypothetical protein